MPTLYISEDTGGSLGKATGHKGRSQPACIAIEPEVIPIIRLPSLYVLDRHFNPSVNAWVSVKSEYYAVGALAREEYKATIPLVKPKIDYFIPRSLAIVAILAHHFKVSSFDVHLSCLLPPAEYKNVDTASLQLELGDCLAKYSSSVGEIEANLKSFKVLPEGIGLLKHYRHYRQDNTKRVAVVLFGHRNISLFEVSEGVCQNFQSSSSGFASILPKLSDTLKLSPRECLAQSVNLAADEISRDVIKEYWYSIESWLTEHIPLETDEVVIGGGAVVWLRQEIINFFRSRLPPLAGRDYPGIFFDGGLKDKDWLPQIELDPQLRVRFADSYLNWRYNYGS